MGRGGERLGSSSLVHTVQETGVSSKIGGGSEAHEAVRARLCMTKDWFPLSECRLHEGRNSLLIV